jgi:hypothetical protein
MHIPTGAVVRILGTAEAPIQDLVRRDKIAPPPTVTLGRRAWNRDQVCQAAEHLGVLTPEVESAIDAAFGEVEQEVAQ